MKRTRISQQIKKTLPLLLASSVVVTGCSGGQEGDTNGGFAGVGLGGGVTTALGVVGGLALVGLLLDDDDSDSSPAVDETDPPGGETDPPGGETDPPGGETDPPGGETDPPGGETDPPGGETDPPGGETDPPGGETDPPGGETDPPGGETDPPGGETDPPGGETDPPGGETGSGATLSANGEFVGELNSEESVPGSDSAQIGSSNLSFDQSNGNVTGTVTVPAGMDPTAVSIMVGPAGEIGFPALELERINDTTWAVPANLSAAQRDIILQNIKSGNLYLAVKTAAFPDGELRRQITPESVYRYVTNPAGANGGSANGYVLINEDTGDYSITWNTSDRNLVSAHLNDGNVSGASETVFTQLTQRPSNTSQFFAYGNVNDPNDPVPNLEELLRDGMAWLDAHGPDDSRLFFGLLQKE